MSGPNRYVLGGVPEVDIIPKDQDGIFFVPSELRLSIKQPDGNIITVSGAEVTTASGYLYYLYRPPTIGWYEYETWVADSSGREVVDTKGFDVIDNVYKD